MPSLVSDLNLPPDAQADHSGPIADPDSFGTDDELPASDNPDSGESVPDPAAVPPPD
jgi:hypothetical protein